jgi:hypothetical protein
MQMFRLEGAYHISLSRAPYRSKDSSNERDLNDFFVVSDSPEDYFSIALQENELLLTTRLSGTNILTIICNVLMPHRPIIIDEPIVDNNIIIESHSSGAKEINKVLDKYKCANDSDSKLILIPYGVTDRRLFRENHSILVAIYKKQYYVIDPKCICKDYQITNITYKAVSPGIQGQLDRTNCGRYTAYIAIYLAEKFRQSDSGKFDLLHELGQIPTNINLLDLQKKYADILCPLPQNTC